MRYRFRGLIRTNGKPVEGHVEAPNQDDAINALSENGIVTESLREEPRQVDPTQLSPGNAALATALESALDISSQQVPFDALSQKYKGKSVWVIDREKIRRKVAEAVDAAMQQSMGNSESEVETRQRVAEAINGLFKDNRNLTSQVSNTTITLERQISRLGNFITKAEGVLAAISVAARSGGFGGGGGGSPRRYSMDTGSRGQNEVLVEIFKANLALRGITLDGLAEGQGEARAEGAAAASSDEGAAGPEAAEHAPVRHEPPTPQPVAAETGGEPHETQ